MSRSSILYGPTTEIECAAGAAAMASEHENDPLLSKVELGLYAVLYPFGFAVEIRTNDKAVIEAAKESWGEMGERFGATPMRLNVIVTDDGATICPPAPVARAQDHLFSMVADAQNQAVCDMQAGFGFVYVNQAAMRHRNYLRYYFLEAAVYIMLGAQHMTPLHAACVSRNGHGLLLCGNSGVGKSTLAYACARAGWTYTSDDSTYLLRGIFPRVIGNSRQVRFRPSARTLFPELGDRGLTPRAEGKPSIEVPTAELPVQFTSDDATIRSIIFLNRHPSANAELGPRSFDAVLEYFDESVFPDKMVHAVQMASLDVLATADAYELRYDDLNGAINCLERLTEANESSDLLSGDSLK
jgi:hypothetical protein